MSDEREKKIQELEGEVRRLTKKADELQRAFDLLDQIPDNLRRQLSDRADYAGTLEVEIDRLRREYEEPGVRCCRGHLVLLPRKVWDCPLCVRERAKKVERLLWAFAAKVIGDRSAEEAGAGDEFQAVIEALAELVNERVLAKLEEFNRKGGEQG